MISYQELVNKLDSSAKKSEYSIMNGKLCTAFTETEDAYKVQILSNLDHLTLHWGVGLQNPKDWKCPQSLAEIALPTNTIQFDDKAAQSRFVEIIPTLSTLEITIPKTTPVKQLNFVVKRDNNWFNNNNANYSVAFKEPEPIEAGSEIQDMVSRIISAEASDGSWTLMHRFKLCNEYLNKFGADPAALGWIFVWMRYSSMRKLTWQRKFNTRPSELASSQQNLTYTITNILKSASSEGLVNPTVMLRGILSTMGRGGGNGQRIRDQILEIMHKNGIKEHDSYYEQWHQKLHNNTTPDDVGICEATIAFNETNNMGKFWEVLNRHGITRERLRGFERPITMEPYYAPQMVGDLYNYLGLLKAVHGGTDLRNSVDCCRGFLPGDLVGKLNDLLGNLSHWDKISQMEKTLGARTHLKACWNKERTEQFREALYLDSGLEEYTRQLCEEIIHVDIRPRHLLRELRVLLQSVQLTVENPELSASAGDFCAFSTRFEEAFESDVESALIIKASTDRLQRLLGTYIDVYNKLIDSKARRLGTEFSIDAKMVEIFVEDTIRGSLLFAVSMVLKKIDGHLRRLCNFKSWQVISPKPHSSGLLCKVDSLHAVAYEVYPQSTVLICDKVTGEEEIPDNVTAVISCTELDALAHVCVRARNNKVLLAVCFDPEEVRKIERFVNSWVLVTMTSAGVSVVQSERVHEETKAPENREVKKPLALEKIAISAEEFCEGKTGAKGNNCAALRRALPQEVGVPCSAALPYGTCEYFLATEDNQGIAEEIEKLTVSLQGKEHDSQAKAILDEIKGKVLTMKIAQSDREIIQKMLTSIGCNSSKWEMAWKAIKAVWASKYNERVYLCIVKASIPISAVVMSVLCQEVITGDYAYVLHTKNPFNDNMDEIYGEIVLGLGETLVGAFEGRALSFVAAKNSDVFEVKAFPNKSVALRGSGFIFRSDSNSEDLPGFAGAGLFDSIVMEEAKENVLVYGNERIVIDREFRRSIILKIKQVGVMVEQFYDGVPQDIEGVVVGNKVYVVQARPQV